MYSCYSAMPLPTLTISDQSCCCLCPSLEHVRKGSAVPKHWKTSVGTPNNRRYSGAYVTTIKCSTCCRYWEFFFFRFLILPTRTPLTILCATLPFKGVPVLLYSSKPLVQPRRAFSRFTADSRSWHDGQTKTAFYQGR